VSRENNAKIIQALKDNGMELNEVDPQELAKIKEKLQPVIAKHVQNIGEDLVQRTMAEIEKVRGQKE
jgi:TRAP-type transport system periplasmic protein